MRLIIKKRCTWGKEHFDRNISIEWKITKNVKSFSKQNSPVTTSMPKFCEKPIIGLFSFYFKTANKTHTHLCTRVYTNLYLQHTHNAILYKLTENHPETVHNKSSDNCLCWQCLYKLLYARDTRTLRQVPGVHGAAWRLDKVTSLDANG